MSPFLACFASSTPSCAAAPIELLVLAVIVGLAALGILARSVVALIASGILIAAVFYLRSNGTFPPFYTSPR